MERKTRRAALVAALTGAVLSLVALLQPARVSADSRRFIPDVTLINQDGETVNFYDLVKGRVVAIDLIYTTCQYACPLETARLARLQQLLGDRMGKEIFFFSISIDPVNDTPEKLKAYAQKYQAGPGWMFLTGKQSDIDMLSKKLGLWTDPSLTQDGHTPMLLIGNETTGQWTQTSALDNPKYTAVMIEQWIGGHYRANKGRDYAQARPIAKPADSGEYEFKSLCSHCHTVGGGDKVGPDLSVALDSRERSWLTEYVVQPDVMRVRKDPIAKMLSEKYPHVRMPNLFLTVAEAKSILRYVELQKSHPSAAPEAETPAAPRAAATTGSTAAISASPLIASAIAIQTALARDSMVGIGAQAAALRDAATAAQLPAVATAAGDLARQTTIAEARRSFGVVSEALVAYARSHAAVRDAGVRIGYCPMLRKSWLQKDGPVQNPYYGSRMLSCGELTN